MYAAIIYNPYNLVQGPTRARRANDPADKLGLKKGSNLNYCGNLINIDIELFCQITLKTAFTQIFIGLKIQVCVILFT